MRIPSVVHSAVPVGLIAVLASACSSKTSNDCVSVGVPGIQVAVLDPRTNRTPAGTVVTATDGGYREVLAQRGEIFVGAVERPGRYSNVADAPGYVRWIRDDVSVVRSGSCSYLQRVVLSSELQPSV